MAKTNNPKPRPTIRPASPNKDGTRGRTTPKPRIKPKNQ